MIMLSEIEMINKEAISCLLLPSIQGVNKHLILWDFEHQQIMLQYDIQNHARIVIYWSKLKLNMRLYAIL